MKKSLESLELVESGSAVTAIPVKGIKEKKVRCKHSFTRQQIIDFAKNNLSNLEARVLMTRIKSCAACEEDARKFAADEGLEDEFIDRMGW